MHYVIVISLVFSLVILTQIPNVSAECCAHGYCNTAYRDEYIPGWCCGCGACNIFCCNCANGCNRWYTVPSKRNMDCNLKKRSIFTRAQNGSLEAEMLFKTIDIDGNNAINITEADDYFKTSPMSKRSAHFFTHISSLRNELKNMDTNDDGQLSLEEFDESLKM